MQFADREQRLGQLILIQPVQEVALIFGRIEALEQFVFLRLRVLTHAGVVPGGDTVCTQAQGVVQKGLELDLGIAKDVRIGRAPSLVLTQELGKNPVPVFGGKVDVLDLDAKHVGHRCSVNKVDVRRAVL